jgi:hypothetical protein
MNYLKLIETDFDVLKKIDEAEKNDDFSAHIDSIDFSSSLPVSSFRILIVTCSGCL